MQYLEIYFKMRAWRCILPTKMWWVWKGVESRASRIKIYVTFDRSSIKTHRIAFVSCSRVKACNFSGFVNTSSETFLEKLSPLNELRDYGNWWEKLRPVRKPVTRLLLWPEIFFWPIRSGQFKCLWNWFGKSKCRGARLDVTVNFHHGHFIDPTKGRTIRKVMGGGGGNQK